MSHPPLAASALVAATLVASSVSAQGVQRDQPQPAEAESTAAANELPVSVERIRRSLERMPADATHDRPVLGLREFVVVVGEAPAPLFSPGALDVPDPYGASIQSEMARIAMPARASQALGSDALGAATVAAFFAFVPPAIGKLIGWMTSDDAPESPGTGYSGTFVLDPATDHAPTPLLFQRVEGQRVALHARIPAPARVMVRLGPGALGTFEGEVTDHEVPTSLLAADRAGNVHSLWVDTASDTMIERPITVEVMVVVHPPAAP